GGTAVAFGVLANRSRGLQVHRSTGRSSTMFSSIHRWLSGHRQVRQHKRRLAPRVNRRSGGFERLEDRSLLSVSSFLLYTGVDGEAPEGPPGRIEIESFSFGTANSGTPSPSGGAGRATVLDFIKAPTNHEPS